MNEEVMNRALSQAKKNLGQDFEQIKRHVKIWDQYKFLEAECFRVKQIMNENAEMFDVTSASFIIMSQYRTELKKQMKVLFDAYKQINVSN